MFYCNFTKLLLKLTKSVVYGTWSYIDLLYITGKYNNIMLALIIISIITNPLLFVNSRKA